jgi:nicotinamide riboside kinase
LVKIRHRIGISGTHCCGKTTLAYALSEALSVPLICEVAAGYTEEERQKINTQHEILLGQIRAEKSKKEFVSDRTVIDNFAYIQWHARQKPMEQEHRINYNLGRVVEEHLQGVPYTLVIHVKEKFDLVEAPHRSMDEKQQEWVFNNIKNVMRTLDMKYMFPVLEVSGSTEQRMKTIMEHVDRWDQAGEQFRNN